MTGVGLWRNDWPKGLVAGTITIDDYAELVKTNSALMAANKLG